MRQKRLIFVPNRSSALATPSPCQAARMMWHRPTTARRFAAHVKRGKLNAKFKMEGHVMTTITFDTLKFANTLKAAGVPPAQAEAVALSEVLEVNFKDLVTKKDMHCDMRDLEQRLIIKLGALIAVAIGLVAALVKLL